MDQLGTAYLTARMLDEATTDSTAEELSNRLDKLGFICQYLCKR